VCKELAQLNDFNPITIKAINWRCATNGMKQYCHQVHLRQTPWTLDATIKCTHIMAHKHVKNRKNLVLTIANNVFHMFWMREKPTCTRSKKTLLLSLEGKQLKITLVEELWGARGE